MGLSRGCFEIQKKDNVKLAEKRNERKDIRSNIHFLCALCASLRSLRYGCVQW